MAGGEQEEGRAGEDVLSKQIGARVSGSVASARLKQAVVSLTHSAATTTTMKIQSRQCSVDVRKGVDEEEEVALMEEGSMARRPRWPSLAEPAKGRVSQSQIRPLGIASHPSAAPIKHSIYT